MTMTGQWLMGTVALSACLAVAASSRDGFACKLGSVGADNTKAVQAKAAPEVKAAEAPSAPAAEVKGKNFKLSANGSGDCKAGAECTVVLRLEAEGDYHINKEYPYKFKANDVSGVEFLGKGDKNVFSKASGDFKQDGEKVATMSIRFKPASKGNVTIAGQYKMSVCSAANCQLETQDISAAVAVK